MTESAADLIGAMLGTLFLALGLAAGVAAGFRSARRDRALLWFGVFTALYGLRLIVRSDSVQFQAELPVSDITWEATISLLTFQRQLATGPAQTADGFIATLVDAARRWVDADFADDVTVVVVDWV